MRRDNYIIIGYELFASAFHNSLIYIDFISLRKDGLQYEVTEDDRYVKGNENFLAEVWHNDEEMGEMLVYVPHTGRLYVCDGVLDTADIIKFLIDNEDSKIKKA